MDSRARQIRIWLACTVSAVALFLIVRSGLGPGAEPVYQNQPLSYWVGRVAASGGFEPPEDAAAAIRAIGPKAVPFLLGWMPLPEPQRPAFIEWIMQRIPHWPLARRPSPDGIWIAWSVLGAQGKAGIPALARVVRQPPLGMGDYSAWTENAMALSFLGPDAVPPMLAAVNNLKGNHAQWELIYDFGHLGSDGVSAIPALIHWADDPDYWVRLGVMDALGNIGQRPDLCLPVLTAALQDSNALVRRDAAGALGNFGRASEAIVPALTNALDDPDWQARSGALMGLGRIRSKPEVVIPLIAPNLYDHNSVIARSAAFALRDLGNETASQPLLSATNAPYIRDIIYQVRQKRQPESK